MLKHYAAFFLASMFIAILVMAFFCVVLFGLGVPAVFGLYGTIVLAALLSFTVSFTKFFTVTVPLFVCNLGFYVFGSNLEMTMPMYRKVTVASSAT